MSIISFSNAMQSSTNPDLFTLVIVNILTPVLVAVVTYLVVDRLGEWQKRRAYSKLGVAIIESLQEEISTGIDLMNKALTAAEHHNIDDLPRGIPPSRSWGGMSTIQDEVLLRILETSANHRFVGFPPKECRIHCKNYFEHICKTYEQVIKGSTESPNWSNQIQDMLSDHGSGRFAEASSKVYQMLDSAKKLLEENSRAVFPK